jgi:hypothetical protein
VLVNFCAFQFGLKREQEHVAKIEGAEGVQEGGNICHFYRVDLFVCFDNRGHCSFNRIRCNHAGVFEM